MKSRRRRVVSGAARADLEGASLTRDRGEGPLGAVAQGTGTDAALAGTLK